MSGRSVLFVPTVISLMWKKVATVLSRGPSEALFSSVASSSTYAGNVTGGTVRENIEVVWLQRPWASVTSLHSNPASSLYSVCFSAKFQTV